MIDIDFIFDELGTSAALWSTARTDQCSLAHVAEFALKRGVSMMSVLPDAVSVLWPWLENAPVQILGRFYLPPRGGDVAVSELAARCRTTFCSGGTGAQIFVSACDLKRFATALVPIRDDLFFNKYLSIGIDLADIEPLDWPNVFEIVRNINANSLAVALTRDMGDKSDFVGRVYGMLDSWDDSFGGDLHFCLGANPIRIDQARRLVHQLRPDLDSRVMFFINDFNS